MENQIPEDVVKDRFDRLLKEVQDISKERAERFTGETHTVLVEEPNKREGYMTGRLGNNHVVHFKGDHSLLGKLVRVRLDECMGFYYMGTIVAKLK